MKVTNVRYWHKADIGLPRNGTAIVSPDTSSLPFDK